MTRSAGASPATLVVFAGGKRLARGSLADAVGAARQSAQEDPATPVHVFDALSGAPVDLDLRDSVSASPAGEEDRAPRGRPRLGVVAREVTLLPRHWDWLAAQPGGASAALRRLVEAARKSDAASLRERRDAAYRFMSAIAGDAAGFEEASRALFAGDTAALAERMEPWPADVRNQVLELLGAAGAAD